MKSNKKEILCESCENEFVIEHENTDDVIFCPFCGVELPEEEEEDADEAFEED